MVNLLELIATPRRTAESYSELCPWFSLLPGGEMVLCQDSTLLAGFEIGGIDAEGVEDGTLNQQINILQNALNTMNENIVVWSYVEKVKCDTYPESVYFDEVSQYIEDAWKEKNARWVQTSLKHTIFIGFKKQNLSDSFFENVNHQVNESGENFLLAVINTAIQSLSHKQTVAKIKGHLNEYESEFTKLLNAFTSICSLSLGVKRLKDADLLGELFSRMNIASPKGPIKDSKYGAYIPQRMAADKLVRRGDSLRFDGPAKQVSVSVLSTMDHPDELCSIHIDELLKLPVEFCLCQVFEFIERPKAQQMIQKLEMHYRMEVKSLGTRVAERISGKDLDKVDTGNLILADDAQEALVEITSENMTYGFHSMRFLCYGNSERESAQSAESLAGAMRAMGYGVTKETTGLLAAFLSTLPGNGKVNPRKYLASVANVSDLAPIRSFERGDTEHRFFGSVLNRKVSNQITFLTNSTVPYGFNFHEQDIGHTLIVGGTGAGKTTLMNLNISMFQKYSPCNTFIFDKDYSTSVMSVLLGGKHIDINTSKDAKVRMNPVRRMLTNGDVLALIEWIKLLAVGTGGVALDDREDAELNLCVQQVASMSAVHWRLSTVYTQMLGLNKKLALKIAKYVDASAGDDDTAGRGQYSAFFDNDEDAFELTNFVCMETGKLLEIPELAGPFLDYAFYAIDKSLNGVTPTFIYIEEAWYGMSNLQFYKKLLDWLRTLRKKKGFVVMATQAMSEMEKLPDLSAFLVNIPTRIFLPSVTNTVSENAHLYRKIFNLNDKQLEILSGAIPKRDYLIIKSDTTKLVSADMPNVVIKINDACAKEHIRDKALKMAEENQFGWEMKFIKEILNA